MVSDVSFQTALDGQSRTVAAENQLADDFSDFLNLLTIQLQNQDPLEPMDTNEFTNQIVAFTQVEQQINTNQKLDSLLSLQLGQSFSQAQNYVGNTISYVSSELNFEGDPMTIRYGLDREASLARVNILTEDGTVIYSQDLPKSPGANEFTWDGSLNGGGIAVPGTYSVQVDAIDLDEQPMDVTTVVSGRVRGTESQNGQIFLLVGDRAVALSNVLNTTSTVAQDNVSDAMTLALRYIGLEATYENSSFDYMNDPVTLTYNLPQEADRAKIIITDNVGRTVYTEDINGAEGPGSYVWDGTLSSGEPAPAGEYNFSIDALASNTTTINSREISYGGGVVDTNYTLQADADLVQAVVKDALGNTVYTENVSRRAGTQTFSWDGALSNGGTAAPGDYTIEIQDVDSTDTRLPVSTFASGVVDGVETLGGAILLQINGRSVPLTDILNVGQPSGAQA